MRINNKGKINFHFEEIQLIALKLHSLVYNECDNDISFFAVKKRIGY